MVPGTLIAPGKRPRSTSTVRMPRFWRTPGAIEMPVLLASSAYLGTSCISMNGDLPGCSKRWSGTIRSEEHTSELQSLMRISYAVFCLNKKTIHQQQVHHKRQHQVIY